MMKTIKRYMSRTLDGSGIWSGDSDDMVALHGADGRFARVSDSARHVTGLSGDDLCGKTLADITAPDDRGVALQALADACYQGRKGRAEFRILRADGTSGWAEMTASVDAHGQVRTIIRDIALRHARDVETLNARKKAEADAEARSSYLADLSHEIRTPLNAVIGFADMMRNESFGPIGHEKYEEYADLIHKSGQHLLDLVSGLLDMSKIEAGKYVLASEATVLPDLVRECVAMIRLGAEEAGLSVNMDIARGLSVPVEVDPKALRQVLLNLLSNAVKFTRAGSITVRVRGDKSSLWISVIDTGIGMSEEDLARVGNRFEQAHREGVRGAKGTGLGLALSHALTNLHEGELRLSSAPGEGTNAVIRLPHKKEVQLPAIETEAVDIHSSADNVLFENLGLEIKQRLKQRKSA